MIMARRLQREKVATFLGGVFSGEISSRKNHVGHRPTHRPDLRMQRRMLLPSARRAVLDAALAPLRVATPADDHDLLLGGDVQLALHALDDDVLVRNQNQLVAVRLNLDRVFARDELDALLVRERTDALGCAGQPSLGGADGGVPLAREGRVLAGV